MDQPDLPEQMAPLDLVVVMDQPDLPEQMAQPVLVAVMDQPVPVVAQVHLEQQAQ